MKAPSNSDDAIDSRDVIARIAELEDMHEPPEDDGSEGSDGLDDDERAELAALKALAEEGEGLADWRYGETLIRDSYFEDYARELAEDIGALEKCDHWPATCIDWERAARELQMDYTSIDFDGVTYWARA